MEFGGYLRFLFALVFVIGLIGMVAVLARKFGLGFPASAMKSARNRRLGIVEVTPLDGRRRLALVRRDEVEHLILLGQSGEVVVETGIRQPEAPPKAIEDRT